MKYKLATEETEPEVEFSLAMNDGYLDLIARRTDIPGVASSIITVSLKTGKMYRHTHVSPMIGLDLTEAGRITLSNDR